MILSNLRDFMFQSEIQTSILYLASQEALQTLEADA